MADENKIIYTVGYDQPSLNNTRKAIESQLASLEVGISKRSFAKIASDIKANVVPKISFEADKYSIKALALSISTGIGTVPVTLKADVSSINKAKSQIQNNLGKFNIDVKINALDGKLGSVKQTLGDIRSAFESAGKAKDDFASNVQEKFPKIIGAFASLKEAAREAKEEIQLLKNLNLKATDVRASLDVKKRAGNSNSDDSSNRTRKERTEVDKTTDAVNKLTESHNKANNAISSFSERLGFTTTRLAAYLIPALGIYRLFGAFDTARRSIIEINSDITKLSQVLGNNSVQADKLADSAFQIGIAYGKSGKELVRITTELARINRGLGTDQTLADTLKVFTQTNLSVGFGRMEETIEGTKDVLSQFNKTGRDTAEVLDTVASLTKKFDVNADDLFTSVKAGGAVFSQAGGNIKQFASLVTAIKQLTGLPSTAVGNAINSLSFRLQQPELIAFVDRLTNNKVRNADGTLRDIGQRIIEIAKATKNLGDQDITNIVDKLVGTRQGKILAPLLRDIAKGKAEFSEFSKIVDTINNAPGEVGRDAAQGLKRLDIQLESVSARFEEVFKNLSQNKGIQELVAQFASLAKSIATTVDAIGPLLPTLLRIGAIRLGVASFRAIPGITRGLLGIQKSQADTNAIANGSNGSASIASITPSLSTNASNNLAISRLRSAVNSPVAANVAGSTVSNTIIPSTLPAQNKATNDYFHSFLAVAGGPQPSSPAFFNRQFEDHLAIQRALKLSGGNLSGIPGELALGIGATGIGVNATGINLNRFRGLPFASSGTGILGNNFIGPLTLEQQNRKNNFGNQRLLENGLLDVSGQVAGVSKSIQTKTRRAQELHAQKTEEAALEFQRLIAVIKEERSTLKTLSEEQKVLANELRNETVNRATSNVQTLSAAANNTVGARANRFLFGPNNVFGRAKSGGINLLKRSGADIATFGGAAALDIAFQNVASRGIEPIVDSNGQLLSGFQSSLQTNRSNTVASGALQGGATGLGLGASIGSAFGPVGTAIGGGIGGIGGAIFGGVSSSGEANRNNINALFGAASSAGSIQGASPILAEQARLIRNFGGDPTKQELGQRRQFLGNPTLGVPTTDELIFKAIAPKTDFITKFGRNLQGPEADAFKQRIRAFALTEAGNLGASGVETSTGGVRARLTSQLAQSFQSQGFGQKASFDRASAIVSESFRALEGNTNALTKSIEEANKAAFSLSKELQQSSDNLALFAHRFNLQTKDIALGNTANNILNQNFAQVSSAALGRGGSSFQLSDQLPGLLSGNIQQSILDVDATQNGARNSILSKINRSQGGLLSQEDQAGLADVGLLEQAVRQTVGAISGNFSGQRIDSSNAAVFANKGSQILNEKLSNTVGNQLQTTAGKKEFGKLREDLGALLGSNPQAFQGNPEEIVKTILKDFNLADASLSRFSVNVEKINTTLRTSQQEFQNELEVRGRVNEFNSQALNIGLKQVNRGAALGLNDVDISHRLRDLVGESLNQVTNNSAGDFKSAFGLAQIAGALNVPGVDQFANVPSHADVASKSLQGLQKAQEDYKAEVIKSHDALTLLDAQFQHLNQVLTKQENANTRIALTPINQRREAERGGFVFNSLTSSFFGKNGSLNDIRNPRDLLRLSPAQIASLSQQASRLAGRGDFINSQQSFLGVFGDRQAVGGPAGTTNNDRARIINLLAGLGVPNAAGGRPDLQQYIANLKALLDNAETSKGIDEQQLDALHSINQTLIEGFHLQGKVGDSSGILNFVKGITQTNIPINNIPIPNDVSRPHAPVVRPNASQGGDYKTLHSSVKEGSNAIQRLHEGIESNSTAMQHIAESMNQYIQQFAKIKDKSTNIKFDGNLNVTGVDFSTKDVAIAGIVIGVLRNFAGQLNTSNPAEAELKNKLLASIKQLEAGLGQSNPNPNQK
jgi:hypothetical protein